MRLIDFDLSEINLPENWQQNVDTLKAQIEAQDDSSSRSELINANQELWRLIKPELAKKSYYKCWYTDSPQQGTDVDVDHYRPKNRIAELRNRNPPHTGYWWLAFDIRNYRYSCIIANRRRTDVETSLTGGKADFFPIFNENSRAWSPSQDYEEEQPILLDPCKIADVRLLDFKEDGEAMPRESAESKPHAFTRAAESIRFYHLNHSDFVRARQDLRDELSRLISSAKRYYNKLENGDAIHEHAYEETLLKIRKMCSRKAPYSSFCVAYVEKFKYEDCLQGLSLD